MGNARKHSILRAMMRQERAGPVPAEFHAGLTAMLHRVSSQSELAGAMRYALVRWTALTLYRYDGRIEIDNNSAERSIRSVVTAHALSVRRIRRRRRASG